MTSPRDLPSLVRFAVEAEQAGFDAVMVSEHVVLGRGADSGGLPSNPRDYALPGNQDPTTPWPSSLVLLGRRGRDHPAPAGGRRDHPAAPASAPVGEGLGHARSPVAGTTGRAADRELAPRRVRRARRSVRCQRCAVGRAPRGMEHLVAGLARIVRRRVSPVPRRLLGAEAVPSGRADAVVRRELAPRAARPTHRHVRARLQPVGASRTGRPGSVARRDGRRRPEHGRAGDGRRDAWGSSPIGRAWPTWDARCPRSRNRSRRGSRRSASSRRSSSTTRGGSGRSVARSWSVWRHS